MLYNVREQAGFGQGKVKGKLTMMNVVSALFFVGLAVVIVYIYLGIRRGWGRRRTITLVGTGLSAVAMTLVQVANPGADILLAVLYGAPLGALLGLATAAVAFYFARAEDRAGENREEFPQ